METHMNRHHVPIIAMKLPGKSRRFDVLSPAKSEKGMSKVHKRRGQLRQMNRKRGSKEMKPIPEQKSGTYRRVGLECIARLAAENDRCEGSSLSLHHAKEYVNDADARRSKQQDALETTPWTTLPKQECSRPSSNVSKNQHDSQDSTTLYLTASNSSVQFEINHQEDKGAHADSLRYGGSKHMPSLLQNSYPSNRLLCPQLKKMTCADPLCINQKCEGSFSQGLMNVSGCPNIDLLRKEAVKRSRDDIEAASTLWGMLHMHHEKENKPRSPIPQNLRYLQTQLNQMALGELVEILATLSDRTVNQVLRLKKGKKKLVEKINNALQRKLDPSLSTQTGTSPGS